MKIVKSVLLSTLVLAIPASAQAELKAAELKSIRAAASRPVAFSGLGVVQEFTGNFDSVAKNFDAFSKEFRGQKIQAKAGQPALLILLEDPTGKSEFRYEVGYPVAAKVELKAPLQLREMQHPQAVRVTHVGDYGELEEVHTAVHSVFKQVSSQKETKFPVVLRLLSDPRKAAPGQRKIEMVVPVG